MILCIGDYIEDHYTFGTATRICPEGPVPVVVPNAYNVSAGGVGLVANQLQELGADVYSWHGSMSKKTRIFAGSHLICRLDEDSLKDFEPEPFPDDILRACECVVVSDYGKGAIFPEIVQEVLSGNKPMFVDAKKSWAMYDSPFSTWFPNEHEYIDAVVAAKDAKHHVQIVHKRGAHGARWGEMEVGAVAGNVVDTTGAGDIFLAAFVHANMIARLIPGDCVKFANTLAGESCRHIGTYVVPRAYAQSVLYKLEPSLMSGQPIPFEDSSSNEEAYRLQAQLEREVGHGLKELYIQIPDSRADLKVARAIQQMRASEQTLRKLTLDPKESDGVVIPSCVSPSNPTGYVKTGEHSDPNPNESERQREHKLERDQWQNP